MTDERDTVDPSQSPPKRRGRPPNPEPAVIVALRMTPRVYDAYAQCALAAQLSVSAVLREVLEIHAPRGREDADRFPYSRK